MSPTRRRRLAALLKASGIPDLDPVAIEPAFIHESAAREGAGSSNERLEFYGDSILGWVAARYVWATYPSASEGELHRRRAALVSGEACAHSARRLGFSDLMRLGVGMQNAGGASNATILADAFEAYIGALAMHLDIERVARFIELEHLAQLDRADEGGAADAKTALQEFTQGRLGIAPVYLERSEGPPHDRRFTSQVKIGNDICGEGIGSSKKAAQQSAAAMALAALRSRIGAESPPESLPVPSDGAGRVIPIRPHTEPV